jgi:hypothetical protein
MSKGNRVSRRDSAESFTPNRLKRTAYFIENCDRHSNAAAFCAGRLGFMVGAEAEHSGHYPGRRTLCRGDGHCEGAEDRADSQSRVWCGLLRDGWAGFDPDFIFSLPTADGRDGRRQRRPGHLWNAARKLRKTGMSRDENSAEMEKVRETYDRNSTPNMPPPEALSTPSSRPKPYEIRFSSRFKLALIHQRPHIGAFRPADIMI